jgi:hypothetical protein
MQLELPPYTKENAPNAQLLVPPLISEQLPLEQFSTPPKTLENDPAAETDVPIATTVGETDMGKAFPHPSDSCEHPVNAKLSIVLIKPGYEAPGVTLAKLAIKDIISLIYHRQKAQKTPGNYSRGL